LNYYAIFVCLTQTFYYLCDVKQGALINIEIMEKLTERVWEYSLNNPDGFTLNIETMKPIKYGISVAYLETQNNFGKESLKRVINHALKHNKTVGGWMDNESKLYYFDSVMIFKNNEIDKAIEFAKQNDQLAIFDLTNLKEIRIK